MIERPVGDGHRLAPERIVPVLRPYREEGDAGRWYQDPGVVPYLPLPEIQKRAATPGQ